MKNVWPWIFGIVTGLLILTLLLAGGGSRQAYRIARGAVNQRVEISQDRISAAADRAVASVDVALKLAGNLPSQQAKADLIKQDIEEISNRLKDAAQSRGDVAMTKLDATISLFNKTMSVVNQASKEATDPAAKATLNLISSRLELTKDLIVQAILYFDK
jgi:hypothetical protein